MITENEFAKICRDVAAEGDVIYKHNPLGTREETLLWMVLNILLSYLSVADDEQPCFTGKPDTKTYKTAISFVLRNRKESEFDEAEYLRLLS